MGLIKGHKTIYGDVFYHVNVESIGSFVKELYGKKDDIIERICIEDMNQ